MDSEASEQFSESEEEIDSEKHARFVESVLNLNKTQHVKQPTRTEPTLNVSEFNLVKSIEGRKGSAYLYDLTKALKNRSGYIKISKKVRNTGRTAKTLPKPLEKPQAERIRRGVAFEKTRLQLDRWEALVTSNRAAPNLSFPLEKSSRLDDLNTFKTGWRVKTELEKDLEKINPKEQQNSENVRSITMQEIMERRSEAAKLRAHQSYREAKSRRQNKIKSKKFHRIQRKEKIKQQLKEFERLQKTDPEEALKKLEDIERARAQERMSLRHRSTGQWARNKQVRAKYDKESRQALAQQLSLSHELTQKLRSSVNSDSESDCAPEAEQSPSKSDNKNPWINGAKLSNEVHEFYSSYRKYWEDKNNICESNAENKLDCNGGNNHKDSEEVNEKLNARTGISENSKTKTVKHKPNNKKKNSQSQSDNIGVCESTSEWNITGFDNDDTNIDKLFDGLDKNLKQAAQEKYTEIKKAIRKKKNKRKAIRANVKNKRNTKPDLSFPVQASRPAIDEPLQENTETPGIIANLKNKHLNVLHSILSHEQAEPAKNRQSEAAKNIDPNKFINLKTIHLSTEVPDLETPEENEEQRNLIAEAFEDDDVLRDFDREKQAEIKKDIPEDINLALPGWGNWGGKNLKVPSRKRKRFIIKLPKKFPRRDDNKGDVIINENANVSAKSHMVSEVPFPFKTVKDFEASIRAPLGNTFIPETAFRRLTKPAVKTKIGTIIEPLDESLLLKKNI